MALWAGWRIKLLILGVLLALGGVGLETGRVLLGNNFHVVLPDQIYRGAQCSPDQLERLVKKFGIRTVVNLRGLANPSPWYLQQLRRVQQLGIDQQDVGMSASRMPPAQEMRRLVEIIDKADRPIYFHCRRGSDRTGLASVVARLLLSACSWEEARGQLSWRYGHVAVGRLGYIDEFFDLYTAWLGREARQHSVDAFRHWILHEYRGGWCNHEVEEFRPLARRPSQGVHSSGSAENSSSPARTASCVTRGEPIAFQVRLRNTGLATWNITTYSRAGFHLGYRVWDESGQRVMEYRSCAMEERIAPGAVLARTLVVPGELPPGRYRIMVDLVDESHGWFYQMGAEPMEGELNVCE